MEYALALIVLIAVVGYVVLKPLGQRGRVESKEAADVADLEAAKEAKYREIRDTELDFRTGKLSEADWRAQDRALRAQAVELLRRLDALGETEGEPSNCR